MYEDTADTDINNTSNQRRWAFSVFDRILH
jgi:hypothetical protein